MPCPTCAHSESRVLSTKTVEAGTRRLRQCGACGFRWRTLEVEERAWRHGQHVLEVAGTLAHAYAEHLKTHLVPINYDLLRKP